MRGFFGSSPSLRRRRLRATSMDRSNGPATGQWSGQPTGHGLGSADARRRPPACRTPRTSGSPASPPDHAVPARRDRSASPRTSAHAGVRRCRRPAPPYRPCGAARRGCGQQLARVEGFGQIVVRAHLQSHDPVRFLPSAVSMMIGVLTPLPRAGDGRWQVRPRHHQVQDQQVETARGKLRVHLPARRGRCRRAVRGGPETAPAGRGFPGRHR